MKSSVDIYFVDINYQNLIKTSIVGSNLNSDYWFFEKLFFHHPRGFYSYEIITITYLLHLQLQTSSFGDIVPLSGGSRNFRTVLARSWRDRILGVWGLFWCPFVHTLYVLVVSSSREYDTYCTLCMLTTIKEYVFKIHKNTPTPQKKSSKGASIPPDRLCLYTIDFVEIHVRYHYTLNCEDAAFSALLFI